jgi:invasion protein IalB
MKGLSHNAFIVLSAAILVSATFSIDAGAETKPATKLSQANPPSSSTEKKPMAPGASQAQPAPAPEKGPGWAVNCKSEAKDKGLECRMTQTVVLKGSGQVLTSVTFRVPADTKTPEMIVQLPLGVFLSPGASYQIDTNPAQRLNYRACDRNGCFAIAPVTPEALAVLKKGKQIKISFQNLAEKPITVPLSLDGFGEAYEKMLKPA